MHFFSKLAMLALFLQIALPAFADCLFNDPKAMLADVRAEIESKKISPEKMNEYRDLMKTHKICPEELAKISAEALSFQTSNSKDTYSYESALKNFLEAKDLGDRATNLAIDMAGTMKSLTQRRLADPYINRIVRSELPVEAKKKAIYTVFLARYYGNKLGIGEQGVAAIGKDIGPRAAALQDKAKKREAFRAAIQKQVDEKKSPEVDELQNILAKKGLVVKKLADVMVEHNLIVGEEFSPKPATKGSGTRSVF